MSRPTISPALIALAFAVPLAGAQTTTPTGVRATDSAAVAPAPRDPIPPPANDSLYRRARRMVSEGNGAAGRALVDSLLATTDPATPEYGDALYWHGALAPTAAAAEADYRRVIVEYPLAYYSGDALLAIAELEQARGDRVGAMQHLQRFVREHPENPGRGIAALGVARLAFEQRDSTLACSMLVEARRSMSPTDVETRNQVEYYANRCTPATTTAVASAPAPSAPVSAPTPAPSAPVSAPAKAPATSTKPAAATRAPLKETLKAPVKAPAKAATRAAPAPKRTTTHARTVTRYTVQVAAYNTRGDADALVKRLAARGIKAHVSGTSKPFRVRLALHATRKDANTELAAMRKRGIDGFVAEEEVITGARTP
ncbi:MAG TPA: SPOR domain-containing protein [Gemmatimonadaceae bacterium]|nr:SPOR domain-containing protein [Gemmatimonadaceae bacterium]